jgi:hypothetical protein
MTILGFNSNQFIAILPLRLPWLKFFSVNPWILSDSSSKLVKRIQNTAFLGFVHCPEI